jgi:hypothetical protein
MPYKLHCVQIDIDDYGVGAEKNIPDCTSAGLSNNPQLEAIITAGNTMPYHAALIAQRVAGSFSTLAVAAAIDAIGLDPLPIDTDTEPGVTFYLAQYEASGILKTGGAHRSLLVSGGAVVPRRLTCTHQGHATLDVDVIVVKESANNAIVLADTASLPTVTGAGLRWTLGKVKIGNITLSDYTSVEIDFGNTVTTRGTQSAVWDTYVEVLTHAPSITVRGIDPAWFKESGGIPIAGLSCTHANTVVYFKKRDPTGAGFVADGTAEHISFTACGVATVSDAFQAQSQMLTDTSITVQCRHDGTNTPIVCDTTAAIV